MSRSGDSTTIAAVRGAILVPADRAEAIHASTARLLTELLERNRLRPSQVVSAVFTTSPDLHADYPAHAARQLGWTDVPLLGATEMDVAHGRRRVVRVLLTVRDVPRRTRLEPAYLDGADVLRPDLTPRPPARAGGGRRIAIVGLGQIGGSIGLALGIRGGWRRVGFDRDPHAARAALARGAVDEIAASLDEACAGTALAVIAAPVDAIPRLVGRVARALPRGAVLMDTGSARRGITAALARAARRGVRAVGGHPLAGHEGRGLGAARADAFSGAPFLLLPAAGPAPRIARDLVRDLGARPVVVTAAAHDRALARTSHLPYLLACAIATSGGRAARRGLAGPGFRGMTRLAASDRRMAEAYVRANAREVRAAWASLRTEVERRLARVGG